jgi:hypothetical protein
MVAGHGSRVDEVVKTNKNLSTKLKYLETNIALDLF